MKNEQMRKPEKKINENVMSKPHSHLLIPLPCAQCLCGEPEHAKVRCRC